jgi:hypothetical protein
LEACRGEVLRDASCVGGPEEEVERSMQRPRAASRLVRSVAGEGKSAQVCIGSSKPSAMLQENLNVDVDAILTS